MFNDSTLQNKYEACPPKLQTLIAEFQDAFPEERVEMMIEFSDRLPDLPAHLHEKRDQMEQVHECQSPVFLHTEIVDGRVHFDFDIPRQAPTIRGYAGILAEGMNGVDADVALNTPDDVYRLLGLDSIISHLRLRGLHALLVTMKRQVAALTP